MQNQRWKTGYRGENEMITITLNKIRACDPCEDGWKTLLKSKGVSADYDAEFPLTDVIESNGFDDTLWCMRCLPEYNRLWRKYAVWCARQIKHLMVDQQSQYALDVADRHADGMATDAELAAAWDAARAASAASAVRDAARAAVWAARDAELAAASAASAASAAWDAARAAASAASSAVCAAVWAARDAELAAARAAASAASSAWDAARAAASASSSAVCAAVWAAACDTQKKKLIEILTGDWND
jgi:hypothetical protein